MVDDHLSFDCKIDPFDDLPIVVMRFESLATGKKDIALQQACRSTKTICAHMHTKKRSRIQQNSSEGGDDTQIVKSIFKRSDDHA